MTEGIDPYRRVAAFYDRIFEPMNRGLRILGLRMFPPEQGMKVLDVGCGTGVHLDIYRQTGCELYGVDPSPAMLEIARSRLGKDAQLTLGSADRLPYDSNFFDLTISMLVLHEMDPDIRRLTLDEMKRVTKPGGRILLIDFNPGPARPLRGWITKSVIFLSEVAAGQRHFRNYRQFISTDGLLPIIRQNQLIADRQKIVSGGTLALYLLKANENASGDHA